MSPLVSVILPVYNREAFVADAVQSILDQTFVDLELIIIDDGSTDSSLKIIKQFSDSRIKILQNKNNSGVSAARNRGILKAKGEYIALADSDDLCFPERLAKQLVIFHRYPDLIVCGSWMLESDSNKTLKYKEKHEEIVVESFFKSPFANPTVMIKKKIFETEKYDEELKYGEDYELWSRTMWLGRMYNIQEPLVLYRVHFNQLSQKNKKQQLERDVKIQLSIFKKIPYSQKSFPDEILIKVLLFNSYFSPKELKLFLKWLMVLEKSNVAGVFPPAQLEYALGRLKQNLLFKIFFCKSDFGLNRRWRFQALRALKTIDILRITKFKVREYKKNWSR